MTTSIRASSLNMIAACPARLALLAQYRNDTPAMSEGRAKHAAIEILVRGGILVRGNSEYLEGGIGDFFDWLSTPEAIVTYVRPDSVIAEVALGKLIADNVCATEQECSLKLSRDITLTGHIDALISVDDNIFVIDWKTGHGQRWHLPRLSEDLQMSAYALMSSERQPVSSVHILRVLVDDRIIEQRTVSNITLQAERDRILQIAKYAAANPMEYRRNEHCNMCLVRAQCPQVQREASEASLLLPPFESGEVDLTEREAGLFLAALPQLNKRIDAIQERAKAMIKAGVKLPHPASNQYARLATTYRDKVVNPELAIDMLRMSIGSSDLGLPTNITLAQIKSALKDAGMMQLYEPMLKAMRTEGAIEQAESERVIWG